MPVLSSSVKEARKTASGEPKCSTNLRDFVGPRPGVSEMASLSKRRFNGGGDEGCARLTGAIRGCGWKRLRLPCWKGNARWGYSACLFPSTAFGSWPLALSLTRSARCKSEQPRTKSRQPTANEAYRQIRALDPRPADIDHGPLQLQVCLLPHGDQRRGVCGTS